MPEEAEEALDRLEGAEQLETRTDGPRWFAQAIREPVRPWPYFGGLAVFCLTLQVITGILLAFVYQPTFDHAYASAYYISYVMPYGWLVRTVHAWGVEILVVLAAIHAGRMLVSARYKRAGASGWVIGALALGAAIALAFTGRVLPWDQPAYWDTLATVSLLESTPLIGEWVSGFLTTASDAGGLALTRFYAAHITFLPAALVGLVTAHVWVARRSRAAEAARPPEALETPPEPRALEAAPLYPDLVASAITAIVLLLAVYAALAILMPSSLDVRADPAIEPGAYGPAWYFLAVDTLARYVTPAVATSLAAVLAALFVMLPFLDRGPSRRPADRTVFLTAVCLVALATIALTVIGATR